jgi:hypothetical protein
LSRVRRRSRVTQRFLDGYKALYVCKLSLGLRGRCSSTFSHLLPLLDASLHVSFEMVFPCPGGVAAIVGALKCYRRTMAITVHGV